MKTDKVNFRVANQLEKTDKIVLGDINLTLKSGQLLVVIGTVGTGKTSLLHAVMGETNIKSGFQFMNGSVAYVE